MYLKRLYSWLFILCWLAAPHSLVAQDTAVRKIPAAVIKKYQSDKAYEYANDPAYWNKKKEPVSSRELGFFERFLNPALWRIIGYGLLAFVFLFVIYRLFINGVFYSNRQRQKEKELVTDGFSVPDESDLRAMLQQYRDEKNFRDAIRIQYLLTLRYLESQNRIRLEAKATNQDYLRQMEKDPANAQFAFLTRIYEYAWYGELPVSEQNYQAAEARFNSFKHSRS